MSDLIALTEQVFCVHCGCCLYLEFPPPDSLYQYAIHGQSRCQNSEKRYRVQWREVEAEEVDGN